MVMTAQPRPPRGGRTSLGCLFILLIAAAAGYFAVNVGEVYLRYYRFRDAMAVMARFAERSTDEEIVRNLRAVADSIGVPADAAQVAIRRTERTVQISSAYEEVVEIPMRRTTIKFTPSVEHRR